MDTNILTIRDIKPFVSGEIGNLFTSGEIRAITNTIITEVLKTTMLESISSPEREVTTGERLEIKKICAELRSGKPLQYIIGETEFYGLRFKVDPSTLIPRPETEELVRLVLSENPGYSGSILDIGTGSGCIAVALAANMPGARVMATDISDGALAVARGNGANNGAKVEFIKDNILESTVSGEFGIIVSNPPYVRDSERNVMARNVVDFEPHTALFVPDNDPLVFYRVIVGFAAEHLIKGGKIYFEINEALGGEVKELLEAAGYKKVEVIRDMCGRERITKGEKNG